MSKDSLRALIVVRRDGLGRSQSDGRIFDINQSELVTHEYQQKLLMSMYSSYLQIRAYASIYPQSQITSDVILQ